MVKDEWTGGRFCRADRDFLPGVYHKREVNPLRALMLRLAEVLHAWLNLNAECAWTTP
jgi:hypothetical protein